MNNLPKVVTQQRRGRASNPRLLDRKSDALPLSHRATLTIKFVNMALTHTYSYFTACYYVSFMEQHGGALWRIDV